MIAYMKTNQTCWWLSARCRLTTIHPRTIKFETVFPTRMVHKKFSGFSRYPCKTSAERLPARICCLTRKRLNANTPASMPEHRNDNVRQAPKTDQIKTSKDTGAPFHCLGSGH